MVYLTSLYGGDYKAKINQAIEYGRIAADLGVFPVTPYIMYGDPGGEVAAGKQEIEWKYRLELLNQSNELWVLGKVHSAMMKREISYAGEHNIPAYHIPEPDNPKYYPISCDGQPLLCKNNCMLHGMEEDIKGKLVVLPFHHLSPEYRSPVNQLWEVSHGPGCRPDSFTGTVHIRHPIDGDWMAVGRHELCGVASTETMKRMFQIYPSLDIWLNEECEAEEAQER